MSTTATPARSRAVLQLTDEEARTINARRSRRGYVARLEFAGPRGRRYRSIRTAALPTAAEAERAGLELARRPYAHGARAVHIEVLTVRASGVVEAREEVR